MILRGLLLAIMGEKVKVGRRSLSTVHYSIFITAVSGQKNVVRNRQRIQIVLLRISAAGRDRQLGFRRPPEEGNRCYYESVITAKLFTGQSVTTGTGLYWKLRALNHGFK